MSLADQLGMSAGGAVAPPAAGSAAVAPAVAPPTINPLLAKLLAGYQGFIAHQAQQQAQQQQGQATNALTRTTNPGVDPLVAQGGQVQAYQGPGAADPGQQAAAGLPQGAAVNSVAGNAREGKPFMTIGMGGREFHVYYGSEFKGGRKVVELSKPTTGGAPAPAAAAPAAAPSSAPAGGYRL